MVLRDKLLVGVAAAEHEVPDVLAFKFGFELDEGVAQLASGGMTVLPYVTGHQEPGVG